MQNHQVPIIHTQGALTQNPMHTNPTSDQSWHISNQQSSWNEQRFNQGTNITVDPIRQIAINMHILILHISNKHRVCRIQQIDVDNQ